MTLSLRGHWTLAPDIVPLNHGSFGACPRVVLEAQSAWRARLERDPVRFLVHELEGELDAARAALGKFLNADHEDLAFVQNPTTAVNAIVRSMPISPGDELVCTNHGYNACRNVLEHATERGARVVVAQIPFPGTTPEGVVEAIRGALSERTRLVLVDHVTSPTGLVFPVSEILGMCSERGVDVLVDGAHGPGMLDVDLTRMSEEGATYYVGALHKWCCAPKGASFLYARRDRQAALRPVVLSHGANSPRRDRSRFRLEFDWTGTGDYTPYLCAPTALDFLAKLAPGGWAEIRDRNRAKALAARRLLSSTLDVPAPAPESMVGSLVALPLPPDEREDRPTAPYLDALQERLYEVHRIQVPVFPFPGKGRRVLRLSAAAYNEPEDFVALSRALAAELRE